MATSKKQLNQVTKSAKLAQKKAYPKGEPGAKSQGELAAMLNKNPGGEGALKKKYGSFNAAPQAERKAAFKGMMKAPVKKSTGPNAGLSSKKTKGK